MIVSESCIACILNQVERVARINGLNRGEILELIRKVMTYLIDKDWDIPPPVLAEGVYRIVGNFLGKEDPYKEIKDFYTKSLLKIYNEIVKKVEKMDDPLKGALFVSVVGNSIDFGAEIREEIKADDILSMVSDVSFYIDRTNDFIEELKEKKGLMIIGDNTGETVLDKVLIEILRKEIEGLEVYYVTRGRPVINDATLEDAIKAGINEVAVCMDDGNGIPGFYLPRVKDDVKDIFMSDIVVLSKGQGNFETLDNIDRKVYLSFKIKCTPVSRYLNVPVGSYVFMENGEGSAP